MPPAVAAVFTYVGFTGVAATIAANIIGTILLNISLGSLEFRDGSGARWIAVDE
jgi:hypothetical protein